MVDLNTHNFKLHKNKAHNRKIENVCYKTNVSIILRYFVDSRETNRKNNSNKRETVFVYV